MMDLPFLTDIYEKDFDLAKSKGWSIDVENLYKTGPVMIRESKVIWRVEPGQWGCADMVFDTGKADYKNYREYSTLNGALEVE